MKKIAGYKILETLSKTHNSVVYRCQEDTEGTSVIVKTLKVKHPSPTDIARFKQEFDAILNIDLDGVVKAYDMSINKDDVCIVMQDFNGVVLSSIIQNEMLPLSRILDIGRVIAHTLGELHKQNIIHKD